MKLYVDDLRKAPDDSWTVVRTNTEAIRLLATGYVSECSIDHDICVPFSGELSEGVRRRLQIGEETFQPVVYYITMMQPEFRPKKITMHTSNQPAGEKMIQLMGHYNIEATYVPASYHLNLDDDLKSEGLFE
jgi:hypothetical protein